MRPIIPSPRSIICGAAVPFVVVALVGCGTTDKASRETLPPMRTTTSSAAPTTTTIPEAERFYVIQSGDTLAVIAARAGVTVQSIVELNGLANPDAIQAGQTIEIPSNVVQQPDPTEPPTT